MIATLMAVAGATIAAPASAGALPPDRMAMPRQPVAASGVDGGKADRWQVDPRCWKPALCAQTAKKLHTFNQSGLQLDVRDLAGLPEDTIAEIERLFFTKYPLMMKEFNEDAPRKVLLVIAAESAACGIAYDSMILVDQACMVTFWTESVFLHEMMHIIQAYDFDKVPRWITEGVADYGRDRLHSIRRKRSMEELASFSNVTGDLEYGYQNGSSFMTWMEINGHPGLVERLNEKVRKEGFSETLWPSLTGEALSASWNRFKATAPARASMPILSEDQLAELVTHLCQGLDKASGGPSFKNALGRLRKLNRAGAENIGSHQVCQASD